MMFTGIYAVSLKNISIGGMNTVVEKIKGCVFCS